MIVLPANQILRIFYHHDLILFQHRQQNVLQFALPKFPFIKLCSHRLTRRNIREAAHPEEGVGIFDGKKWTQYFHPDTLFWMRGFPDIPSREPMKAKFYEGELWKRELENILLPILEKYDVVLVEDPEELVRW